ncbi:major facilitator superfamily domain-containing protein [Pyronema omphalodes]|nr:major facilitator superfamily domain-containing protein [Pyronema omphalodes]
MTLPEKHNRDDDSTGKSDGEVEMVTPTGGSEYERKLVKKLDKHIVPVVIMLYLLSFLDRVNIGSARLYHMESDLGMVGNQYQLAVSILFVTYIAFELPGNLVIKKITPRYYISFITVAWGIIATLTGIVQSYAGLLVCRLLLGAVEAGLFPGLTLYLTFFYTKTELALRIGYLFVSAALAGACGGLLAYAIGYMDGIAGQSGWRWILIIEGIPTIIMGVVTFFALADDPETAPYLTEEERAFAVSRMSREAEATKEAKEFRWEDAMKAVKDWRVWVFSVAQFCMDTMLYGYSTFLPTMIKGIGAGNWSNAQVQALTIPCYALGAIAYLVTAWFSDKKQQRGLFTAGVVCFSLVGYAILISPAPAGAHYFACFLVATGLYVAVGIPLAWLPSNCPRYGKRATASGIQLTLGNASGVLAPFLFPTADGPRFFTGYGVSMALVALGIICHLILWFAYRKVNKDREAGKYNHLIEGMDEQAVKEMGDDSPNYRYTI